MLEEFILVKDNKNQSKLKILALTGRLAAEIVKKYIPPFVDLKILPVNVAAFITKDLILDNLTKEDAQKYDLVLTPGLVSEDLASLKAKLGVPVVKGPRYASDIKMTLAEINPLELSSKHAADKFLKIQKTEQSQEILQKGFSEILDESKEEFFIGEKTRFPIGIQRPPIIMAEIVDATQLSSNEIIDRTNYYLQNRANIIDIGAVANKPNPKKIKEIIELLNPLKRKFPFALSIDTLNVEEIKAAIEAQIDLILSIDHGNIDDLIEDIPKEVGIVFVPTNVKNGYLPRDSSERINSLLKLRDRLKEAGFTKLIADPIIEMPIYPGFVKSLNYYSEYRKIDPLTPMMTCVGNVTEFIEADPIGINALFGCLAVELGIQLLLMTDVSVKCRGSIKEIVKARDLAFVAKSKNAPPKSHGINLLMARSRTANDLAILEIKDVKHIKLSKSVDNLPYSMNYKLDPKGSFTIWIDYHKQTIYVTHLEFKTNRPTILFSASKARPIFEAIMERQLISEFDHAYYIGRELERAEICLYLGKTYVQNEQVFKDDNNTKNIIE
ncbi:MAG: dihydropteroate synthase-like protein [Asgard group archaeon]|nr:dihydropteroate synthase-like protein [Asgard group archaeon]